MPDESSSLLRQYVRERSQEAFAQIVRLYVDMVYASARRQVRDAELAQDVTQAVFLVLSQKAATVPADRPLSAWLLTTTRYVAANARRAREHRDLHERRAAQMARAIHESERDDQQDLEALAPLLDEGLNKLGAGERDALVLKYFEKKSLRQVGEALGISEAAATKRVSRAIERLRVFFQRRGATASAALLAALLASESAQAAPTGLTGAIAGGASTSAANMAKSAIVLMATEKAKAVALIAATLLLTVGGAVVAIFSMSSSSSQPHDVVVTPPTQASAATLALDATSSLRFSNGTIVQVLAISNMHVNALAPARWWGIDGSPVARPALRNVNGSSALATAEQETRQIVLRMSAAASGEEKLAVRVSGMRAGAITTMSTGDEKLVNCVLAVPSGATTATLEVGLSRGGAAHEWVSTTIALSARPVQQSAASEVTGTVP